MQSPMVDYDIFRERLAITYPLYGHALWEPAPRNPDKPVQVGDVGFVRRGKFYRLFNALLSHNDESNELGVPEYHEPLVPALLDHLDTRFLGRNNYCSPGVSMPDPGYHSGQKDFHQVSFQYERTRGAAVLSLPVAARRVDTLAQGDFKRWIVKHIDNCFAFARSLGLGIQQMEEIILVTGCDLTRSWTNVVFLGGQVDAQVSFGVRVEGDSTINFQFSPENARGAVLSLGPEGTNLPENQCVFIRGFRVVRSFWILPRRLEAAAGPSSDQGGYDHDPDTEVISIPSDIQFRDPLHLLLDYIAEQATDCDTVLAHDGDLGMIDGLGHDSSIETLEPDVMTDLFRRSNIKINKVRCDLSPTGRVPNTDTAVTGVKVAMLSMTPLDWNTQTGPQSRRSPLAAQNLDLGYTSQSREWSPPLPMPGQFPQPSHRSVAIVPQGSAPASQMGTVSFPKSQHRSATSSPPRSHSPSSQTTPNLSVGAHRGADIQARHNDLWTPLHIASRDGNPDVVRLLLERGADLEAQLDDHCTPLHIAADNGKVVAVRSLLDHGANIQARRKDLWTPLHIASCNGNPDVVRLLLDRGADLEARLDDHSTPLHIAADNGKIAAVQSLLDHGANSQARRKDLCTPLHGASWSGNPDVVRLLLDRGANLEAQLDDHRTPLHIAAFNGNVAAVRSLLDHGANIQARCEGLWTPLHSASWNGNPVVIRLLLERGANLEARLDSRHTPLHIATENGNVAAVQELLENGAISHVQDNDGQTPLHHASSRQYLDIMGLLLKDRADIDVQDNLRRTPLDLAVQEGKVEAVQFLLRRGANAHARNDNRQTPLQLAEARGNGEIIKLFSEHKRHVSSELRSERNDLAPVVM